MEIPGAAVLGQPAAAVAVVIGLLLVFFGRRLFWIFVGGIGFVAGVQFAPMVAPGQPQWVIVLIAIGLGIIGAIFSIVLQRVAVALAGSFAGGLLATRLALELGWTSETSGWIAFIAGAVIAAGLVSLLYDWALIALTTLSGVLLISDSLTLAPGVEWVAGIILVVTGAVVQARALVKPAEAPSG